MPDQGPQSPGPQAAPGAPSAETAESPAVAPPSPPAPPPAPAVAPPPPGELPPISRERATEAVAGAAAEAVGEPPSPGDGTGGGEPDAFTRHPEYFVGGAFAGGIVLAQILRWLGRD